MELTKKYPKTTMCGSCMQDVPLKSRKTFEGWMGFDDSGRPVVFYGEDISEILRKATDAKKVRIEVIE